mmetsp:Transcript_41791/g.130088  ORF Transcript_41791/g.130088 Transcript_41791/m.130088 type:complete len:229 (+) Transcript_41791:76-762(+)
MALRVEVSMLSGALLRTVALPLAATAGDVRAALAERDEDAGRDQEELLQTLIAGGAQLIAGSEVLEDGMPLKERAGENDTVKLSLILNPSPLVGKTFRGNAPITTSGVCGGASGKVTFKNDDTCDVYWDNGYTSAGHADSANEGEFEGAVEVSLPKVSIVKKGKGRRRHGSAYGGYEEDAWKDDAGEYTLEGSFAPETGLQLRGWEAMAYYNYPMNDHAMKEEEKGSK